MRRSWYNLRDRFKKKKGGHDHPIQPVQYSNPAPFESPLPESGPSDLDTLALDMDTLNLDTDTLNLEKKTRALRAFRTISFMLSLIQSNKPITNNIHETDLAMKKELRPLDALAAIAAIAIQKHGIAAAVGRRGSSGNIEVLTSASADLVSNPLMAISQPSLPEPTLPTLPEPTILQHSPFSLFAKGSLQVVYTRNGRTDANSALLESATIFDPSTAIPKQLEESSKGQGDIFLCYLTSVWPQRTEILETSFFIHLWMINKLLERISNNYGIRSFLLYIIASCYPKIRIRMGYRTSQAIFKALKDLRTFHYSKQSNTVRPAEKANDIAFLTTLIKYQHILQLTTALPNLTARATTHPSNHDYYTEETCIEFHLLLSELLELFNTALTGLDNLREHDIVQTVVDQLELIARLGQLLRLMIKGSAIKRHLQVIERFLPDNPVVQHENDEDNDDGDNDDGDNDDGDNDGDNDEGGNNMNIGLDGTLPNYLPKSQSLSKWQTWSQWLELLVIHFDSAHILSSYVEASDVSDVSITVLSEPLPDTNLLIWTDLLREICPPSFVEELITFLKSATGDPAVDPEAVIPEAKVVAPEAEKPVSCERIRQMVKDLNKISQTTENVEVFTDAANQIIHKIKTVTNCTSPLSSEFIPKIVNKLDRFKDLWVHTSRADTTTELTAVDTMLRTLRDNAKFFLALKGTEPLCTGTGLRCSCHCESSLAAHCYADVIWEIPADTSYKQPIGVSKRCCPICAYLLTLLRNFTYTHSHNTITPCSLPQSLPLDIINSMVLKFGSQLINELVDLKMRTNMLTSVDDSIGSGRMSVGSENPPKDMLEY